MRLILRQLMLTASCLLGLYFFAIALSYLIYPSSLQTSRRDVWDAGDSLYMTSPRYAFLNLTQFAEPGRKVVILGASNAGYAFRQAPMQQAIPCAAVYDYAIGGANISQVAETADLILDMQKTTDRHDDMFVIGVWYGMFADSAAHWHIDFRHPGDTDLDLELYRYGFYHRGPNGPVASIPVSWLDTAVVAIRPYLMIEKLTRDVTASLRERFLPRRREQTDQEREAAVVTPERRRAMMSDWQTNMGNTTQISSGEVKVFSELIEKLLLGGSKVVIFDLPLPSWHKLASPYYTGYQAMLGALNEHFRGRPGFALANMDDLTGDTDYSDEVHPKPHLARVWRQRLAQVVDPIMCPSATRADSAALSASPSYNKDIAAHN